MLNIFNKLKLSHFYKQAIAAITKSETLLSVETVELAAMIDGNNDEVLIYAALCELSRRTLGLTPYSVQIAAAMACANGDVIDMKTGEGKTLVAALSAIVLNKKGYVSVIATANNYLANRDMNLMSPLYNVCGVTVSRIRTSKKNITPDVYYSHLTEEGCLTWLGDHLAIDVNEITHPQLLPSSKIKTAIIVDEIDHSLIDSSAVNYSIISDSATSTYWPTIAHLVKSLGKHSTYLTYDENGTSEFTPEFYTEVEKILISNDLVTSSEQLYSDAYEILIHYRAAYTAYYVLTEGVDYVIKEQSIMRLDERTGRLIKSGFNDTVSAYMHHKHNMDVPQGKVEIISCALQHYIKRFDLLSGMSGTAKVNALELKHSYGVNTLEIPQNKPTQRIDHGYVLFASDKNRLESVFSFLGQASREQRPTLVVCDSEASAESVANSLIQRAVKITLLTSSNVEHEAEILSNAGKMGSMIITTRMCGRGTDIVCEDTEKGLLVVVFGMGKTKNDDLQIIGRTGRQGARGDTYFCLSLNDEVFTGKNLGHGTSTMLSTLLQSDLNNLDKNVTKATSKLISNIQSQVLLSLSESRKRVAIYNKPIDSQLSLLMKKRETLMLSANPNSQLQLLSPDYEKCKTLIDHYHFILGDEFDGHVREGMAEGLTRAWYEHHKEIINIKLDSSTNAQAASNINNFKKSCFNSFERFSISVNQDIFDHALKYLSNVAVKPDSLFKSKIF